MENKLLEFEEKKYNLRLEYLNKQQELYKNDLQKFTEIEHQKLIATAEYGKELTAAVRCENVMGCQFHPEKSGRVGLNILKAFCEME